MTTFLAGGTGTPKLLAGAAPVFPPAETTVVGNTGDDVAVGGLHVSPDVDTVLYLDGGVLDRETWWGVADDDGTVQSELERLADAAGLTDRVRYLDEARQTEGRRLSRWRRFSGAGRFIYLGDADRAVHHLRTGLLDEGRSLTAATRALADAFDLERELLPMSDDPVATMIHTPEGVMHFQEFWVARGGEPAVEDVEFRGADAASPTDAVLEALTEPVVIGPSNPVTSIGPMVAMEAFRAALAETTVVAVSPFVGEELYSGPAGKLLSAVGYEPSTAGVLAAYPYADAFVLDEADPTEPDRPAVRTDITLDDEADAERVARAAREALEVAG